MLKKVLILVATLAALCALLMAGASWADRMDAREQTARLAALAGAREAWVPQASQLRRLPPPVARFVRESGALGVALPMVLELHLSGKVMEGREQPVCVALSLGLQEPGLVERASAGPWGLPLVRSRRWLLGREAGWQKGLFGLIGERGAEGEEQAEAELIRWLAFLPIAPGSLAQPGLRWESLGSRAVAVRVRDGALRAEGRFRFAKDGRLESFEAERPDSRDGLRPWRVEYDAWSLKGGQLRPSKIVSQWPQGGGPSLRLGLKGVEPVGHGR